MESQNCGVEEKEIIRPFSDTELEDIEREYLEEQKKLNLLKKKLADVTAPIKEDMKPLEKTTTLNISRINAGGERVIETVYCFPDYETHLMGLYDSTGTMVGTRAMTKFERQLHINSLTAANIAS